MPVSLDCGEEPVLTLAVYDTPKSVEQVAFRLDQYNARFACQTLYTSERATVPMPVEPEYRLVYSNATVETPWDLNFASLRVVNGVLQRPSIISHRR